MESALIAKSEAVAQQWWRQSEELRRMTFQIALIGNDGLVVASDRRTVHMLAPSRGQSAFPQSTEEQKFTVSPNENLICFFAGGAMSVSVARTIASECSVFGQSIVEWEQAVDRAAKSVDLPYLYPIDEIVIVRRDTPTGVWLLRKSRDASRITVELLPRLRPGLCVGASLPAQFLPQHLARVPRTIEELRKLALLTLSYAAEEEPTYVGPPFDLMVLDNSGNVSWSVHQPIQHDFQEGLQRLFDAEVQKLNG